MVEQERLRLSTAKSLDPVLEPWGCIEEGDDDDEDSVKTESDGRSNVQT